MNPLYPPYPTSAQRSRHPAMTLHINISISQTNRLHHLLRPKPLWHIDGLLCRCNNIQLDILPRRIRTRLVLKNHRS